MAKKTNEDIIRQTLVQYMALSGEAGYNSVGDYSTKRGFYKKDYKTCISYYIDKGMITGDADVAFKGKETPVLNPLLIIAVVACTPIEEAQRIFAYEEEMQKNIFSWERHDNKEHTLIMKALNAYLRMRPAFASAYERLLDYFVSDPTESEIEEATKVWNETVPLLKDIEYVDSCMPVLLFFPRLPNCNDFLSSINHEFLSIILNNNIYDYQNFLFFDADTYSHYQNLTEALREHKDEYENTYDKLVFFHKFLKEGNIDSHLPSMHEGTFYHNVLKAMKMLQSGDAKSAFELFAKSLKADNAEYFRNTLANYYFGLSILLCDTPAALKKAESICKKKCYKEDYSIPVLKFLLQKKTHPETNFNAWISTLSISYCSAMERTMFGLLCKHFGHKYIGAENTLAKAKDLCEKGINVLAVDFANNYDELKQYAKTAEESTGLHTFLPEVEVKQEWEFVMDAIIQKCGGEQVGKTKASTEEISRVSYLVDTNNYNVQPRLQKSKNGGATWSVGRNIALTKFYAGIPEMTGQDSLVAKHVKGYSYGWYGGVTYELYGEKVIETLIDHPYVYDEKNPDVRIDIKRDSLQIEVKKTSNGYKIVHNLSKKNGQYDSIYVINENAQSIKVVTLSKKEIDILELLDRINILPEKAKDQLIKLLESLGKTIKVVSPLMKDVSGVVSKKGDTKITIQLVPEGEEIKACCYVKPYAGNPPYCTPGKGLEYVATTIKGKSAQIERNLRQEKKSYDAVKEWLSPFDEYQEEKGWRLPVVSCLEMLDILRQHQDECYVEWPEGVRFKVSHPMISASALRLSVKGINSWFECDGEVNIDEKTNIKIAELLKRVRESKGNFIQLGDAEYVAISQQLKKQLAALDHVMQNEHKQLKVAMYNGSFIQDLQELGVDVQADEKFEDFVKNLEEADTMKVVVPKNLQADLRDYQKDGYRWLSRLAHWGAGACLADDMGLGKTLQTITLLLSHASEGASLVIVPTSVLLNWRDELARFAPSLNAIILRNESDRQAAVDKAGKQDVVLATYGLLPTEEELLAGKEWNIIVLDEAHNIKNKETKTSKVAMQLKGKFRLLLTGTPLQNHLGEIWNLFQFATPGLLPNYTQFNQQFINPIEHEQDKERQRLLKRMLSPFILRRTKSEVLDELPEKTEITLKVELSQAERALYDQFRQEAIMNLEDGTTSPIQALAELTKLRQVACNAALVLPKKEAKAIPSSKMEAFLKLIEELRMNHHRALVFSQFTSHLALVRNELDKLGIEYNYLDGSTPPSERMSLVESFQKGSMPLFLISLKAGGTGLNLTAADYVIHLDPWWNPAIEDQASDRAYRIGQDKPVTVYRIIATDTIEDKIIELHQTKKSLADALLEGSDMSHTMGKDEILALLSER